MEDTQWAEGLEPPFIPPQLVVGSLVQVLGDVWVAMLYGDFADGVWGPGAWIVGGVAGRMRMPLAGPFESTVDALDAWRRHRGSLDSRYGFKASTASVFDPSIVLKPEHLFVQALSRIDGFCKIESGDGVFIGRYVHVASFCHLNIGGGTLVMEDGSSAGSGARILTGSALIGHGSCSATAPGVVNAKAHTIIRKNATVFAGATVSVGCELGEGAALGGGAFLRPHTVVPPGELWAGVPARFIKKIEPVYPIGGAR